jgi:transcriptional regulator with AAA-type ATPase domain
VSSPFRERTPWSELAALVSVGVAVTSWSLSGRAVTAEGLGTLSLALLCALAPRRAAASMAPVATEAASISGALGASLVACTVAGALPPTHGLRVVHALLFGELLGVATAMAAALPLRADTLRRATVPGLFVGGFGALAMWPGGRGDWSVGAFSAFGASAVGALYHLHAVRRPLMPVERARMVAPGVGAAVLAIATLLRALGGPQVSPLVLAVGVAAQVLGLTAGTGAIGLDRAASLARAAVAVGGGLGAGWFLLAAAPSVPLLGVCGALAATALAWPSLQRRLRPDGGRLLDACGEIERALPAVRDEMDLAAAVLDPLRAAARSLRAPAAIWLLPRGESLQIDVSGGARRGALSLEQARPVLAWMRARPGAVFTDTLRPYLVRRAELRPLVDALDALGAIGAAPLREGDELVGALILPRGSRVDVPTYEEQLRVEALAHAVEGVVALLAALDRARARADEAVVATGAAQRDATQATREHARLLALHEGARRVRALGLLEERWIAYASSARSLRDKALALSPRGPVALLAEPGAGAAAVARLLHDAHAAAGAPFVAVDTGAIRVDDALSSLVGDARVTPERAGWLEHAASGTLLLEDLPAMGHDALVALLDALRAGGARRLGAEHSYPVDVRVVVTLRRAPDQHDLPRGLIEMLAGRCLRVPPLRERGEDLESLTLFALERACRAQGRAPLGVSAEAAVALRAYAWPGNLDELARVIDVAVRSARGARVEVDDLPAQLRASLAGADDDEYDAHRPWRGDA